MKHYFQECPISCGDERKISYQTSVCVFIHIYLYSNQNSPDAEVACGTNEELFILFNPITNELPSVLVNITWRIKKPVTP